MQICSKILNKYLTINIVYKKIIKKYNKDFFKSILITKKFNIFHLNFIDKNLFLKIKHLC